MKARLIPVYFTSGKDDEFDRQLTLLKDLLAEVADILGCFGQDPDQWLTKRRDGKASRLGLDVARVEELLEQRRDARTAKDWEAADRIRDELTALGVGVQDGPEGSVWSFL